MVPQAGVEKEKRKQERYDELHEENEKYLFAESLLDVERD